MLLRWKCTCAYDGTDFAGWQSQAGGGAIQDVIEARLARMLGARVRIHGSGRTDAGVHARAQVFHFDAAWRHGPEKLLAAFRTGLPAAIQIKSARPVAADFHARFSATGKIYTYDIRVGDADPFTRPYCWMVFRPLDLAAMRATAARLRGKHDFRAFSAGHGTGDEDTVRHLRRLDVVRRGRRVRVTAEADGFLYKMVRNLVGALVAAAQGRLTLEQAERMLAAPARAPRVDAAPPQGLFLDRVHY
jgi:tRNA pseudouridine38-40 synthase